MHIQAILIGICLFKINKIFNTIMIIQNYDFHITSVFEIKPESVKFKFTEFADSL